MTFAQLLQQAGDRLRRCPVCTNVFVRTGRKNYCSTLGQRLRSQKHYKAHREELLDQRHEAYKRKRRRAHPRAKVARRPRS